MNRFRPENDKVYSILAVAFIFFSISANAGRCVFYWLRKTPCHALSIFLVSLSHQSEVIDCFEVICKAKHLPMTPSW